MCTVSGKLYLPVSKSETTIREAFLAPWPSLVLPSEWVKMTVVQEDLMMKERIQAAFAMVGRVVDVDELSFLKCDREPVRVRFQCRFPERIKGSIQVFVNGESFTVGLQAEMQPRGAWGVREEGLRHRHLATTTTMMSRTMFHRRGSGNMGGARRTTSTSPRTGPRSRSPGRAKWAASRWARAPSVTHQ
jgi:hypothetical protein